METIHKPVSSTTVTASTAVRKKNCFCAQRPHLSGAFASAMARVRETLLAMTALASGVHTQQSPAIQGGVEGVEAPL